MWYPSLHHFASFLNLSLHVRILKFGVVKLSAFVNVGLGDSKAQLCGGSCHGYSRTVSTVALLCLQNKVPGTVCFGGADTSYQDQEGFLEELLTSWLLIGLTTKIKNPATETQGPVVLDSPGRNALVFKDRFRGE